MSAGSIYNHRSLQPTGRSGTAQQQQQQGGGPGVGPQQGGGVGGGGVVGLGPPRLNDAFDTIKQEFDAIASEVDLVKTQKEDVEVKLNMQISELNTLRRSLYELESQHNKVRQQYEDEVGRLRAELAVVRHANHPPGPQGIHSLPSNSGAGIGVNGSGPNGAGPSASSGGGGGGSSIDSINNGPGGASSGSSYHGEHPSNSNNSNSAAGNNPSSSSSSSRSRDLAAMDARSKDNQPPLLLQDRRGGPLPPPPSSLDPQQRGGMSVRGDTRDFDLDQREREMDRIADTRELKRLKKRDASGDGPSGSNSGPGGPPFVSTPRLPPSHALYAPPGGGGPGGYGAGSEGGPGGRAGPFPMPALPPAGVVGIKQQQEGGGLGGGAGTVASVGGGEEFNFNNVPPEFRREGSDWFAAFNPKIKKSLDIALVHSFSHTSVVCCVQFSQDGRYLATGCNQTAQIFDTKSGAKVCELPHESEAHSGDLYIRSVRFSPDGKLLATGAEDRQIRIWDIARKRIRQIFDGHQQEIYSLDFSLDGRLIVSGSGDRTTRIWDMLENTCKVFTITDVIDPNTDAGVTSVAISPNADLVAAGSLDNVIRIWEVGTGALVERLRGHGNSVYSVAFTPDGRGLVTGSLDKTLKLWDVSHLGGGAGAAPSSSSVVSVSGPGGANGAGARGASGGKTDLDGKPSGAGGSSVGSGSGSGGSQCVMDFIGHKDYVLSVSMSSDSRWVVSGSKDRCVHVWDSNTAVLQLMLQGHKNSVISLDLNSANDLLATGSGDSYARIWSLTKV